jgi:hypothetical protein
MNQDEKETRFAYIAEAGLVVLLIVLTVIGVIPIGLCVILILFSAVSMYLFVLRMGALEDELTGEKL